MKKVEKIFKIGDKVIDKTRRDNSRFIEIIEESKKDFYLVRDMDDKEYELKSKHITNPRDFMEAHSMLHAFGDKRRKIINDTSKITKKTSKEFIASGKKSKLGFIKCLKCKKKVRFNSETNETSSHKCID